MTIRAKPYIRHPVPPKYDANWLATELAYVQQAIPPNSIRTITSAAGAKILATDRYLFVDATAGGITIGFPYPFSTPPFPYPTMFAVTITKTDASVNAVTMGATISGAANPTLAAQYDSKTIMVNTAGNVLYFVAKYP